MATRGPFEWTGCGRWESAGFDGSFVADSMAESSMIRGNCLDDSATDNASSFMREEERVRETPAI